MRPAASVLVLLLAPLAAQPADGDAATSPAALDALVERAVDLAEWGASCGYAPEAGALIRRLQRFRPGHNSAGLLRRIADQLADLDQDLELRLRRQHAAEWGTRATALKHALQQLLGRRAPGENDDVVRGVACLAPDLVGLGEQLRRAGYELLGGHGPVAHDELEAARRDLRTLGGGLLSPLELSGAAAGWPDAFGVRTRHFRIIANVDLPLVLEVARHLEALHEVFEALAKEAELLLQAPSAPLDVRLFDCRATFDALIEDRILRTACGREAATVGVYSLRSRLACTFLGADTAAGRREAVENACHEAMHQLFHLRVRGRALLVPEAVPFSWIEEALCLHCETIDVARQPSLGARCDDDLARGLACFASDHDPMARVRRVRAGQFVDAGDYGCAALLASWLLHGGDRETRAAFLAGLRADLDAPGGAAGAAALPGDGDLRTRLEAHADLVRRLPR